MAILLRDAIAEQPLEIELPPDATRAQIGEFVLQWFPDHRVEITADNHLLFMSPTGSSVNLVVGELYGFVRDWNRQNGKKGKVFSVDLGFVFADGSTRCPDVAWMDEAVYDRLPKAERDGWILSVVPAFAAEVRSLTSNLTDQKKRLELYLASGVQLGWLIDPITEQAFIYRPGQPVEHIISFDVALSGEGVLPGFTLPLTELRITE
jgi:Uma2 family endonuclease